MASVIHPSALVDSTVKLGEDVQIGPFCTIRGHVTLGDRVILHTGVSIEGTASGETIVGHDTDIFQYAVIGVKGQDLKYQDESTRTGVRIGSHCHIREFATIHSGTPASSGTTIGDYTQIQNYAHVAHDCVIGDHVVISNSVGFSGHVTVEDYAVVSAMAGVAQFVHIGAYGFVGAQSGLAGDTPPYVITNGTPATFVTINRVGLSRRGISSEDIALIHEVYQFLYYGENLWKDRIAEVKTKHKTNVYIANIIDFIENRSKLRLVLGQPRDRA